MPEITLDPQDGTVGGSIGGNLSGTAGPVGLWGHTNLGWTQGDDPTWLVGGGLSTATLDRWGLYANGAVDPLDVTGFAGAGGWVQLNAGLQVDAGLDIGLGRDGVRPIVLLGTSLAI